MAAARAAQGAGSSSTCTAGASDGQPSPSSASMASARLRELQQTILLDDSLEGDDTPLRPRATLDFEDRREERRRCGVIKWGIETGVPDVGGLGWRSRTGHLLKNQTFYASKPNENLWDNATHAGPKTWKQYHGPKLRCDAPLMHKLDRLDAEQGEWETKRAFLNTARVQTLDRFYHQKVENYQKEIASQWAPHRRARKEVHQSYDCFTSELDSMPVKELKKVLTPHVLKADRDAIRMISKRVQVEETWKAAWKNMEAERYQDTRQMHEERMAYNDMLMELSGQGPRRKRNPEHKLPNSCTARVEELAQPTGPRHVAALSGNVTHLVDFAGLIHVDHKFALEARFPGEGHAMSTNFIDSATESTRAGWPPPPPAKSPAPPGRRAKTQPPTDANALRRGSLPVPKDRLDQARSRVDEAVLAHGAIAQFLPTAAPPAPDAGDRLVQDPLINDALHMSQDLSLHTSRQRLDTTSRGRRDSMDIAPPRHAVVYPVVVPSAESTMERPNWRPRRLSTGAVVDPFVALSPSAPAVAAAAAPRSARGRWPPPRSKPLTVRIVRAHGLPRADRSGHSDPYVTCQIMGKPRSRVKTKVISDSEEPMFDEVHTVVGWKQGDSVVFTVYDHDIAGAPDQLATVEVPSSAFFPRPHAGVLSMKNTWDPQGLRIDGELKKHSLAAKPTIEVCIAVQDDDGLVGDDSSEDEDAAGNPAAYNEFAMPNAEPSMRAVCDHLDDFNAKTTPVPRLGNFWMHQAQKSGGPPGVAKSAR